MNPSGGIPLVVELGPVCRSSCGEISLGGAGYGIECHPRSSTTSSRFKSVYEKKIGPVNPGSVFFPSFFITAALSNDYASFYAYSSRGFRIRFENTLSAFAEEALEIGIDLVEVDIRSTRDGTWLSSTIDGGSNHGRHQTPGERPFPICKKKLVWVPGAIRFENPPRLKKPLEFVKSGTATREVKSRLEDRLINLLHRIDALDCAVARSFTRTWSKPPPEGPQLRCRLLLGSIPGDLSLESIPSSIAHRAALRYTNFAALSGGC